MNDIQPHYDYKYHIGKSALKITKFKNVQNFFILIHFVITATSASALSYDSAQCNTRIFVDTLTWVVFLLCDFEFFDITEDEKTLTLHSNTNVYLVQDNVSFHSKWCLSIIFK